MMSTLSTIVKTSYMVSTLSMIVKTSYTVSTMSMIMKVRKRANIRNPYNKANGKVTSSQLDITNESQKVSPFPTGDHKASTNRRAYTHNKTRQK